MAISLGISVVTMILFVPETSYKRDVGPNRIFERTEADYLAPPHSQSIIPVRALELKV